MADPVATVEKIVRIGLKIKAAVDTVRHNEEECQEIRRRVLRFSSILTQLQQTGMMDGSPAMRGALEDLEETLQQALELVMACQETSSTIRRLITAGELSKKLRRVKDDIFNKVMLASFAINAHTTIVLLTMQAGGHPHLPRQHDEDAGVEQISHCSQSDTYGQRLSFLLLQTLFDKSELNAEENNVVAGSEMPFAPLLAAAIREFKWSELKEATDVFSDGNIIGVGGTFTIYKGVLKDGNVVAIKRRCLEGKGKWWLDSYDRVVLAVSKLRHNNIVKFIGRSHEGPSTPVMKIFKRKTDRAKKKELFWVEEYVPNGSLLDIVKGCRDSRLDWSSLFRIIEGVAQGLHYLHEQRVVHMDVKPDNILLDSNMNPVITDFNFSLVLDDDNDKMDDIDVAGTLGYMDPEFYLQSTASTKNDVYGFGITLLEAAGSMYRSMPGELPVDKDKWAWKAWRAGRIDQEFEPTLPHQQIAEIKRCVHIGLLCAQFHRADRPTMADVLEMLHGKQELPTPKIPWYIESFEDNSSDEE